MYMLDTNILIDFLRGTSNFIYGKLRESDARLFSVSSIVKAELLVGAEKSQDPDQERLRVEMLLLPFELVPFDAACAQHYGCIRAQLEQAGKTIGANDYLIAATALARGAVLVTNNAREFQRVPGLAVEEWAEIAL